ncbi:MAG: magnesium transporter [Akkermansiaceae bacterium]|nr:magnesium transporter [Akkermansiaceae bacterium]NNM30016.1 magnesium transporter [Akkermansiaceae bacterium]
MAEESSETLHALGAALAARDGSAFLNTAEAIHYADLAAAYEALENDDDREFFLRTLGPERCPDVLADLPEGLVAKALQVFTPAQQRELLAEIPDDDRVDILQAVSDDTRRRLLGLLEKDEEELTRSLLKYGEETAGGRMTTQIGRLSADCSVQEALDTLRNQLEDTETLTRIFLVDARDRLVGKVRLRDLAFSDHGTPLREIMQPAELSILATADQEEAANMISKYDLAALPVVDEQARLLGVITPDDAIEILEEESTEDIEKSAGLTGETNEVTYLHTPIATHFRRRFIWLLGLAFLAMASGYVMLRFEGVLNGAFLLALFLPMVIATGGNTGGQAATMVIRAMALGELEPGHSAKVAWKELRLGLLLGLILGGSTTLVSVVLLPAFQAPLPPGISFMEFGLAVGTALAAQVTASTLIGSLLPLMARSANLDPAVIAAPAITTVVDVTGMVIYFTIARAFLGL